MPKLDWAPSSRGSGTWSARAGIMLLNVTWEREGWRYQVDGRWGASRFPEREAAMDKAEEMAAEICRVAMEALCGSE